MMEKRNAVIYALHGYWNTNRDDGVIICGLYSNINEAINELDKIKTNRAHDFIDFSGSLDVNEFERERMYEISDENGDYAKFYVTEETLN